MTEEIKCPACWEILSVDNNETTATCPHCGKLLVRKFYYDTHSTSFGKKVSAWFATASIKASDYASTPKERVIIERDELKERTDKLSAFIGGEKFKSLKEEMRSLLLRQVALMENYLQVLNERLAIWED